ncbi:MAG: glycine cleavage system protein T [Xanthomonadaceae bacterium]|nr:glycine cleavage system protein T [Xanthomonadaceae bacterium]
MTEKTVLNATHRALGARMVDFGGWDMPINYGSQIEEHHAVRRDAGMFDVSHMTVIDLHGARTREFLRHLLANSVDKLKVHGKALYSCMLNEQGGVIDDLIVYYLGEEFFRLVVNAATRAKDLAWIGQQAQAFDVQGSTSVAGGRKPGATDVQGSTSVAGGRKPGATGVEVKERPDFAMIAVQGPNARGKVIGLLHEVDQSRIEKLGKFSAAAAQGPHGMPLFVARTGYTGEDGFEIIVPAEHAVALWEALQAAGVAPAGLGARDTLRLEAGMNLYGQDMDESVSPWEANLGWTIALDDGRHFIGRAALEAQQAAGVKRVMVGVVLDGKGVLRHGQTVLTANGAGEILSGSFAPTLNKAVAFARIPAGEPGEIRVDIRGRELPLRRVKYPFVRDGKPCAGI